jgi:hypothetical protein
MTELIALVHEYPWGTLAIVLGTVYAIERTITAVAHSRRPIVQKVECDCECCHEED